MRVLLVALLVVLPLAAFPAEARSESHRYVIGPELTMFRFGALNVGGAAFDPATGETSVTVEAVDDVAGPGVALHVCQDTDDDDACTPKDHSKAGCGPVTLTGIDPTKEILVWIQSATGAVVGCTTLPAVRGTITATFA